jgi:hypothetical protein
LFSEIQTILILFLFFCGKIETERKYGNENGICGTEMEIEFFWRK